VVLGLGGGAAVFVGAVLLGFAGGDFVGVVLRLACAVALPLVEGDAGGDTDGVAVTVTVAVTVGTADCRTASRGSWRGGSTTTPTRSRPLKSTKGFTVPVCTCPASGEVAVTTEPTGTPHTNGVWSAEPWVTRS